MSAHLWFLSLGALLLVVGFASGWIKRMPVTSAMVYLALGIVIGPMGFGLFHFNPLKHAKLLEVITEVAVLISLFAAGLKMPVPLRLKQWQSPLRLAFVAMALTVLLIATFAHWVLGLSVGAAVLLGAILSPTDPVLATEIQIREPGDEDRLRFMLTTEAGLNDGAAFPFVMLGLGLLGLHELGDGFIRWLWLDLLWATVAARR